MVRQDRKLRFQPIDVNAFNGTRRLPVQLLALA
jgi:hypothetical protein